MLSKKLTCLIVMVLFAMVLASSAFATKFYVQDTYLEKAKSERVRVVLTLASGEHLQGYIKSHDEDTILFESEGDLLVYKHAIASLASTDGNLRITPPEE